jgi:IS5 family transposase
MAVDARVVRSASRPVSDRKPTEHREKRKIRAQMRKKIQRAMRFQKDVDSDWTVKNTKPVFGMKEHASVTVTKGIHGKQLHSKVYTDKGYCGKPNRDFLHMNGIGDGIMREKSD